MPARIPPNQMLAGNVTKTANVQGKASLWFRYTTRQEHHTARLAGGVGGPPRERGRQITLKALRRSHFGSDPTREGPGKIIAVPFLLVANR